MVHSYYYYIAIVTVLTYHGVNSGMYFAIVLTVFSCHSVISDTNVPSYIVDSTTMPYVYSCWYHAIVLTMAHTKP